MRMTYAKSLQPRNGRRSTGNSKELEMLRDLVAAIIACLLVASLGSFITPVPIPPAKRPAAKSA